MDKQTFQEKISQIGTCEDEVTRRELLAELSEEGCKAFDTVDELTKSNNQYVTDNEALRKANMQLFLRIGSKTPEEMKRDEYGEEPKEKRKFEDLFNEKGGIK